MSDRKRVRRGRCMMCHRKVPIHYHEKCYECRQVLRYTHLRSRKQKRQGNQDVVKRSIERPDYRNNGSYQFVKGWTGGGAEMCVHLTPEEVTERCRMKFGPGVLVDDGVDLWWEQQCPNQPAP